MNLGLSLTIPFFNERRILRSTLDRTWAYLERLGRPFELLLGDDGSTDGSLQVARDFRQLRGEKCRIVRNERNLGRGSILTKAFGASAMPVVAYIDADLAIPVSFVGPLLACFEETPAAVCTGSKVLGSVPRRRPLHRKLGTWALNRLIRTTLGSPLSDHQCGLKGFRREALAPLLPDLRETGWAWDTEILVLAQKSGLDVREIPVDVHDLRQSTVRFLSTSAMFVRKLLEFRRRGLHL